MFTGIVQGKAMIQDIDGSKTLKTLSIKFPAKSLTGLQRGASIAINGVCLTVTEFNTEEDTACFDVMDETLGTTNLSRLDVSDEVNFERAAKTGDEIGGHLMSGHIHRCVNVSNIVQNEGNCTVYFSMPSEYKAYLLTKGFIGLNGCSLTLGEVTADEFCVHLIPETLTSTTFGQIKNGSSINLEIDHQTQSIVDTVERVLLRKGL